MIDYNKLIDEKTNLELEIARSIRIGLENFYKRLVEAGIDIESVGVEIWVDNRFDFDGMTVTVKADGVTIT